ncbi:hypothetical protein VTK73DRAFT_903 [Phialemonium thermophilum]|uniref:non-specific serine/threonine protein kinase n=1 Tax=Phialemonium thermophilum TaxID=223376 RepID=A0ABR3Y4M8_9PEZI
MATHGRAIPPPVAPRPGHAPAAYGTPVMPVVPAAAAPPAGTFVPGTKIQVGSHRVVIQKYLSEGGFAHVYLVKLPSPVDGTDQAVLKRVAVPDKDSLRSMRTEVETMKRLKGHRPIVTYIDSHASELRGGGYEVFLLMEYCNGGGLIDFMNTRLQHRLTEPEILAIFADVAEGVACMHYLKPPLLHRDLKVENVLISVSPSGQRKFKLCDFGSAAPPRPAPTTVAECRLMDEDVQKHTTMQYRSPEMIDVYRKQPIDEKSDIWALGVLLYKLCYYTTPFEDQGQLAILNASYKFPSYPVFSDRLKKLIASMLRENQKARPNIYQVLREACSMQGRDVPIRDIYSSRSQSEPPGSSKMSSEQQRSGPTPVVGAVFAPPTQQQQVIPEVERMRRGRLPATSQASSRSAHPSRSPAKGTNGDPFAALDSKINAAGVSDELSSRFPTLDQFSLLHDSGSKFDFNNSPPAVAPQSKDLSRRVAERLADEAFAPPASKAISTPGSQRHSSELSRQPKPFTPPATENPLKPSKPIEISRASAIISSSPELQAISSQTSQSVYQTGQTRPVMVSTGTMTTPPPDQPPPNQPQVYRFPPSEQHRSSSTARQQQDSAPSSNAHSSETLNATLPISKGSSFQSLSGHIRQPSSSRPSLEGARPPIDLMEPVSKSRSTSSTKPRPASTHLESNIDYLREREAVSPRPLISPGYPSPRYAEKSQPGLPEPEDDTNIASNVEFLRSMEESDPKKKDKGHHKHSKRSSLTSLGAGTKNILAGKFGDAFKRFEGNSTGLVPPRTPSPLKDLERRDLTPIAGSEATDGRSDDGEVLEETDDMTPEMRRELERRRLSQEEKRVAAAAAEYRQRVQGGLKGATPFPKSIGGVSRAVSIQNKVQSLLEESNRSSGSVTRTAHGYGHYSDTTRVISHHTPSDDRPPLSRKPVGGMVTGSRGGGTTGAPNTIESGIRRSVTSGPDGLGSKDALSLARPIPAGGALKPAAPPKPTHLNKTLPISSGQGSVPLSSSPPKPSIPSSSIIVPKVRGGSATAAEGKEYLVATDLPGQPTLEMSVAERDDYIRDFQKRFPSLTAIEMVERDLAAEAEPKGGR